ncbi:hypothetical protein OUY22_23000 [Nonomuraea sp. MCN248]|uniref:Uncharacterized protein n=1 Tax=Nonomuraea corallina TaxID=2989783 RepID=A0ABT4SH46_9ACTN|nr:hypothetical protein [Nonomuraea corallina]MDA0636300.1 hypothetical protein [Nonomuraea corallina]
MAEDLSPPPTRAGSRGYAAGIALAGAALVLCAVLPWSGVQASSSVIGGTISSDTRGIDDVLGVYALLAGLAALGCGLAGLMARPRLAALAAVPGGLAMLVLVMFVSDPRGPADRVSLDLGELLSVEPVIRYGWYAALAAAFAVVLMAVLALVRRG